MISTHILDTQLGKPASFISVRLLQVETNRYIGEGITDSNGRIQDLQIQIPIEQGIYQLEYDVAPYFQKLNTPSFFPKVYIQFYISALNEHYHIPLLLSAHAYSTYRGS
ncbi:hydroxyisourate hydrolase [Acinetobacter nectaris]|uniref:hydroxyisourate hydrolase n=1 Tax=Acinetobacter nectaris TaxID=1219382 RepID=UPI001F00DC86|nr:hydroxyisourate hydrolase [Acinetobacter nectaris]MCF9033644.1 hydroxyisourate hydrolase [Acinetobacter nectaris]